MVRLPVIDRYLRSYLRRLKDVNTAAERELACQLSEQFAFREELTASAAVV
jgi:hypothetical protein